MQELPPLPPMPPGLPVGALAQTNPARAIELIDAQINGVKQEIAELTKQLVPGTTDARESAINDQISAATDRLQSLQSQYDRMVTGETPRGETAPPFVFRDRNPDDIPEGVQQLLENGMVAAVIVILGYPLVRLIARRLEPRPKVDVSADMHPRFERLEQGMDAVAIEVERISEGQRFTNKLLSERALPAPNPLDQWAGAKRVEEKIERR